MMLTCARQAAQLSPKKMWRMVGDWLTQRSARLRALCMSTLGLKCPKSASGEKNFQ
jgi:3-methyladenine DNA glycosylase AlkC